MTAAGRSFRSGAACVRTAGAAVLRGQGRHGAAAAGLDPASQGSVAAAET